MYQNFRTAAILLMGGKGTRFEDPLPKQFHNLAGKKVYLHTLETFLKIEHFDEIILVCHEDWTHLVKQEVVELSHKIKVIKGGKTRRLSSYAGLEVCDKKTQVVVIHDAVRPFVSRDIILKNLEAVVRFDAVDTCIRSCDTIVCTEDMSKISHIPNRNNFWRGQTPQSFKYSLILQAHENFKEDVSDDCKLVALLGKEVKIVEGSEYNIKITTGLDLFLAEQILRIKTQNSENGSERDLKGKIYVVVGGRGGIGEKICEKLICEGAVVIPLSRTSLPYSLDLRDKHSVEKAFGDIFKKFGEIDGLINSAGILQVKPLREQSYEDIQETIAVNLTGLIYGCKAARIKKEGQIVNIASSSFSRGRKNLAAYSACKAAVVNFTQALAEELFPTRVNVVVPQRTNTEMRVKNFPLEMKDLLVEPEKVANTIIDVLKNSQLTGTIVDVKKNA